MYLDLCLICAQVLSAAPAMQDHFQPAVIQGHGGVTGALMDVIQGVAGEHPYSAILVYFTPTLCAHHPDLPISWAVAHASPLWDL